MFDKCIKCGTELKIAAGIGMYCPNKDCDVSDGVLSSPKPLTINKETYKQTELKKLLRELNVISKKIENLMK